MTAPSVGTPASDHPSLTELAELDEGLLADERAAAVSSHLPGCADCARHQAEVRAVGPALSARPAPSMPPAVAARLATVLGAEGARRDQRRRVVAEPWERRTTLGTFGADWSRRRAGRLRRVLLPALAAASAAAVVGFGAYVVSASVGLNEPPVVAALSSKSLAAQAEALEARQDLDPHRFSRAWQCARQATEGRIVALANSTVDGAPALLVFTRSGGTTMVTVVTGCDSGRPSPGPSAPVPRR